MSSLFLFKIIMCFEVYKPILLTVKPLPEPPNIRTPEPESPEPTSPKPEPTSNIKEIIKPGTRAGPLQNLNPSSLLGGQRFRLL